VRILLDECVDRRLTREIAGLSVSTVPEMGWTGKRNGELLSLATVDFDAFITVDKNLALQQDLSKFDLAVVVLVAASNRITDLRVLVPELLKSLPSAPKGQATTIS
jgi:Domain of unknown function (DUF5615)